MRFRSILSLSLLLPLAITGAAVIAVMYQDADRHSADMADRLMASVAAQAGQEIYARSEHAVGLAHALDQMGRRGLTLDDSDSLALQLVDLIRIHPNISWISFSNPAGGFTGAYRTADGRICTNQSSIRDGKTNLIEYVVDAENRRTAIRTDADSGYDPRSRPFYVRAVETRSLVWLPPYIFYEQGIPGISCAVPTYDDADRLVGVFSVDYDLNYLSAVARRLAASKRSQVMVFSDEFLLLAHSGVRVVETSGLRDYGKLIKPSDVKDPTTQALVAQLRDIKLVDLPPGQAKSLAFEGQHEKLVATVLPIRLQSGPVMYVATVAPRTDFAPTSWESSKAAILITLLAFAGAGILAIIIGRRISRPVTALVRASEEIGAGDLDITVKLGPIREFKKLSVAFNKMLANLRESVHARTSLHLAREIQHRLLPLAPPRVAGFDIAGFSASCDETGGDYYDFIVHARPDGTRKLIVALGDMMGHGLPSALFMAGARGALRSSLAFRSGSPGQLLTHLNGVFYRDTEGKRFMTMCLVSFDAERGELIWASAGHDPPLIYDSVENRFHAPEGGDLPLGVVDLVEYEDYRFDGMRAGQIMFLGSDGVWETRRADGEQFGLERLRTTLEINAHRSADEIKAAVLRAVEMFRGGAPVRDDITFVVIRTVPLPLERQTQGAPTPAHEVESV
jgi:serine phosphatase RsbU (regulator of sigma subunit)